MNTYLLLDAARMGQFLKEIQGFQAQNESLYKSNKKDDFLIQSVAPFLFSFASQPKLQSFFFDKGWGDSWGMVVGSSTSLQDVLKHFRKFLLVKTEDGEELYFRFYDPRVLRIFLPTCDNAQLKEFFGPIDYFLMENEDAQQGLKFSLRGGLLTKETFSLEEVRQSKANKSPQFATDADINRKPEKPKPVFDILSQDTQGEKGKPSKGAETAPKKSKWNIFDL